MPQLSPASFTYVWRPPALPPAPLTSCLCSFKPRIPGVLPASSLAFRACQPALGLPLKALRVSYAAAHSSGWDPWAQLSKGQ